MSATKIKTPIIIPAIAPPLIPPPSPTIPPLVVFPVGFEVTDDDDVRAVDTPDEVSTVVTEVEAAVAAVDAVDAVEIPAPVEADEIPPEVLPTVVRALLKMAVVTTADDAAAPVTVRTASVAGVLG